MSQVLIQKYLNQLSDLRRVSGTNRESVVREAFKDLLKDWGQDHDLIFIPEYEITTLTKDRRYVDGALLYTLRVPFGYWEAKDTSDNLDEEIEKKLRRGYPQDNIIFEDSQRAVLIQNRQETMRCSVDDVEQLGKLLGLFFAYERAEIAEFRKAVAQFKTDLPAVLSGLREMIAGAYGSNSDFRDSARDFLIHAQETINPSVTDADVREMLIQHILTEEIFSKVFGEDDFHRQNNVAKQLYALEGKFFTGDLKKRTLKALEPYYAAIRGAASQISNHSEKQTFLKVIYENFYKVYNPKAADRLGVIYTPNEVVRFMIEGADWLCEKNFSRNLIDRDVELLDPATGTGTFVTELLEHFRGQTIKLKQKYLNELHSNEVAILPYYVANLNIEATYSAITGEYLEFPNLCFVDTLDNVAGLRKYAGHQSDLFGSLSAENVERIKRQNRKKISVIIGNPPYNANQLNENENNKNREYPEVDKRIKETYIAASSAQKTKLYDMYARFFRWASDRVDENGIIAFVSNSSFIERHTFDGFRKVVAEEFQEIWIIDLKGNARTSGERRRREGGNIFTDQIRVGIAVYFCVKKKGLRGCRIFYDAVRDYARSDEKRDFLTSKPLRSRSLQEIHPDEKNNWINLADNDFESLIPLASKDTKSATRPFRERAIVKAFSLGISTNRDLWVYDEDRETLLRKIRFLSTAYDRQKPNVEFDTVIKWSRNLKRRFAQGRREPVSDERIVRASYRPFCRRWLYDSELYIDEGGSKEEMFPVGQSNKAICFSDIGTRSDYCVLAVDGIADLHFGSAVDAYQQVPLYRYEKGEQRVDNVTDWALEQFRKRYQRSRSKSARPITKDAIFQYVYGVLYDPQYRQKYELNLRRSFPHIPYYADFWRWADWGRQLMDLHIGYDSIEPWPLTRTNLPMDGGEPVKKGRTKSLLAAIESTKPSAKPKVDAPQAILKADKDASRIVVDSQTRLDGVPNEAWGYRLGNRSALEWVLEQYKERKSKDPTIREKFDTYQFSDHKEKVIDLLLRVTRVSVETQAIVAAMKKI